MQEVWCGTDHIVLAGLKIGISYDIMCRGAILIRKAKRHQANFTFEASRRAGICSGRDVGASQVRELESVRRETLCVCLSWYHQHPHICISILHRGLRKVCWRSTYGRYKRRDKVYQAFLYTLLRHLDELDFPVLVSTLGLRNFAALLRLTSLQEPSWKQGFCRRSHAA